MDSAHGATKANNLDLSSMYEGHDHHAHKYHDIASSSAPRLELTTSDSLQVGKDDITLSEVRSIDGDTNT